MKRIMSVDLEFDYETKSDENITKVLPRLVKLFKKHDVKATFFVLGEVAEKYPKVIKELAKDFEIGCHSYDHPDLSKLSYSEVEEQIKRSKKIFDKLGVKVKGFRAPFLRPHNKLLEILKKNGFWYDSSYSSSAPPCYVNFFRKTKPYVDESGVIELPLSQFLWKFVPTGFFYYRFLYPLTKMSKKHYIFYFHPHELLETKESKLAWWRKMFYSRYLGEKGFKLLEEYVSNPDIDWVSCSDYIKSLNLL